MGQQLVLDKTDFKTKALPRNNKGPRNFISAYLYIKIQNNKLKRHVHSYVHCSIIYNSQDMKAT